MYITWKLPVKIGKDDVKKEDLWNYYTNKLEDAEITPEYESDSVTYL